MKIAAMLSDTLHSLVRRPVTEQIPAAAPARLRGALDWSAEGCTGCALCAKDCPANALELIRLDERGKRFIIRYSVDRCTFCGQCVENCRPGCLSMAGENWSLAAPTRDGYTVYFGNEADVRQYLAEHAGGGAEAPESSPEDRGAGDRP